MTMVICYIRPNKLETVKNALISMGVKGMTVSQVMGCGSQRGWKEVYRGAETTVKLLPKIKIELVVEDAILNEIIEVIQNVARTGEIGDGKIFTLSIGEAIRIRTGERGVVAL